MEPDTRPGELSSKERRHYFRFLPNVTTGELLQILTVIGGFTVAYGTYQSDKTEQRIEIAQVKRDAESDRIRVKDSISEIRADIKDMQRTLSDVSQNVAVMKARSEPKER